MSTEIKNLTPSLLLKQQERRNLSEIDQCHYPNNSIPTRPPIQH